MLETEVVLIGRDKLELLNLIHCIKDILFALPAQKAHEIFHVSPSVVFVSLVQYFYDLRVLFMIGYLHEVLDELLIAEDLDDAME